MIGDDKDFIREILGDFQLELEDLSDKITNSIENTDISFFKMHVHCLKGISGNVCANKLYQVLLDIECALKSNDRILANSLMDSFIQNKRTTSDFLKKYLRLESK